MEWPTQTVSTSLVVFRFIIATCGKKSECYRHQLDQVLQDGVICKSPGLSYYVDFQRAFGLDDIPKHGQSCVVSQSNRV
ncbi:hypothetical protein OPQ81_000217 [Rhizoctonia solani]|nr:hypothetical protein OPQ81_000217 [Rhizoctonia solani]